MQRVINFIYVCMYVCMYVCHSIARSRKPPTRRNHLSDISHISWVIAHFVPNFVAMATRVGRGRIFMWHHSIDLIRKPRVGRKDLLHISYTSRVIANFFLKFHFVAMATGLVVVKFGWHHSIALDRENPLLDATISELSRTHYTGRLTADFVPNFVAMATGLVAVQFAWRHSIARPRKPPVIRENLGVILYRPSYPILSQISLPWQHGSSGGKFRWCH